MSDPSPLVVAKGAANSPRHGRKVSAGRVLVRRSTHGPLDIDDPLAASSTTASASPVVASRSHTRAGPDHSAVRVSRQVIQRPVARDLSFLLHPSIYQTILPPFRDQSSPRKPSIGNAQDLYDQKDFFSAAIAAASRLSSPPAPNQLDTFILFYIRLTSLSRLGLLDIAAQESKALEDINSVFYRDEESGQCVLPWALRVLAVRLQGRGAGGFYELARDARAQCSMAKKSGASGQEALTLWSQRLKDLEYAAVNASMETHDWTGAVEHLRVMSVKTKSSLERQSILVQLALLYLRIGDTDAAGRVIETLPDAMPGCGKDVIRSLHLICSGEYTAAAQLLDTTNSDTGDATNPHQAVQLALVEVYNGNVDKAMDLLDQLISEGQWSREAVFNLATCYELTSERLVFEKKENLMEKYIAHVGEEQIPRDFLVQTDFKL